MTGSSVSGDVHQEIITTTRRVEHSETAGHPGLDAPTSGPLEDHDHRRGEPPRLDGEPEPVDEPPRRSGSVPPPTVRSGSDHVGRVDQEHRASLAHARRRFRSRCSMHGVGVGPTMGVRAHATDGRDAIATRDCEDRSDAIRFPTSGNRSGWGLGCGGPECRQYSGARAAGPGLFAGENQILALQRSLSEINALELRVVAAVEDRWSAWKRIGVVLLLIVTLGFVGKVPGVLLSTEPIA